MIAPQSGCQTFQVNGTILPPRGSTELADLRFTEKLQGAHGVPLLSQVSRDQLAVGTAEEDRQLVAHQLAAAAGEDRWPAGETRPVLLAVAWGESPDAAYFWKHAAKDRGVTITSGIGAP